MSDKELERLVKAVKDYAYYFDVDNKGKWISDRKLKEWLKK